VQRDWKLVEVPYFRLDEAADVLGRAFARDPIVARFVPTDTPNRPALLRQLFKASCMSRVSRNTPLLAAEWDNKLVAVANLAGTYAPKEPESMKRTWASLEQAIGPDAMKRIEDYVALRDRHRPPRLHHYLVTIGVDPEYQNMGFGAALLGSVVQAAQEDRTSAGVLLDTNPANKSFYERNKFQVVGTEDWDGTEVLYMYRAVR
jgi:ribosomal protein S18 acetylase RimI-like enzyme